MAAGGGSERFHPIILGDTGQALFDALKGNRALSLILRESDIPTHLSSDAAVKLGAPILELVRGLIAAKTYWSGIDPAARVIIAYCLDDGECNAEASAFGGGQYLVRVNLDGLPPLRATAKELIDADPALLAAFAGQGVRSSETIDESFILATLLLFFHEVAHVVRGHLPLLNEPLLDELSSINRAALRIVVETDADFIASVLLGQILGKMAKSSSDPGARAKRLYRSSLLGAFVLFATFATGSAKPNDQYHSPIVRFHILYQVFAGSLGIGKDEADAILLEYVRYLEQAAPRIPMLALYSVWEKTFADDFRKWKETTEPARLQLEASGKLKGLSIA